MSPIWYGGGFDRGFFKRLNSRMRKELSRGVREQLAVLQKVHKTEIIGKGGRRAKTRKDVWTKRTGELSKSYHIDYTRGDLEGAYGSDHVASRILEEGGTIRPKKKGGYLAIPVFKARTASGGGRPRDYPGLFFKMSKAGKPMLVRNRAGKRSRFKLEVLFVLRKKVKLEARPTLDMALKASEAARDKIMDAALDRALQIDGSSDG